MTSIEKLVSTTNNLIFESLQKTNKSSSASAFSLLSILLPFASGLSGTTLDELCKMLDIDPSEIDSLVQKHFETCNELREDTSHDIKFYNVMLSKNVTFQPAYIDTISKICDCVTFTDSKVVDVVNAIVKSTTDGKIDEILSSDEIDEDDRVILLNVMNLKLEWNEPFDDEYTRDATFFGKSVRNEQFMLNRIMCRYHETLEYQHLILPYKNPFFHFGIVLPKDESANPIILNVDELSRDFSIMESRDARVKIPKFEQHDEIDFIELFKSNGVTKMFTEMIDDVSKSIDLSLSDIESIFVSMIKQKTKVNVNELGTTASSATVIIERLCGCSSPSGVRVIPVEFTANHPFYYYIMYHVPQYYIRHSKIPSQKTILFNGTFQ